MTERVLVLSRVILGAAKDPHGKERLSSAIYSRLSCRLTRGVHLLPDLLDSLALNDPWAYLGVFLGVSLLMLWRLEAMLDSGLEGTALGTLLLPYCSGLGNLIFVALMASKFGGAREVLTNCLVNNVTNLTLLLGAPALCWGLAIMPGSPGKEAKAARPAKGGGGGSEAQINRLSLLLTLTAVLFFSGAVWLLGRDGKLSQTDGIALIGLFLFWQCIQVFDVLKHNVRQRVSFGWKFYVDALVVLACAYLVYESLDWLVSWISSQRHGFISRDNLGWVTGWLMVLPNAILAFYWAWRRRADVVFSSQVGDGHICIPLCLGLFALMKPLPVPEFAQNSLLLLGGAAVAHMLFLLLAGGLPRWGGAILCAAYGAFVYTGLLA
jgi:cation:H+ antiporter